MLSILIRALIPQQMNGLHEPGPGTEPRRLPHLHRFRFASDDEFSGSSLYACRCGVVRHAL